MRIYLTTGSQVNATGEINSTHEFFAYATIINDTRITKETLHWDVTILELIQTRYNDFDWIMSFDYSGCGEEGHVVLEREWNGCVFNSL